MKCGSPRQRETTDYGGPLIPDVRDFRCKDCDLKWAYDRLTHNYIELGYGGRSALVWSVTIFGVLVIIWLILGALV